MNNEFGVPFVAFVGRTRRALSAILTENCRAGSMSAGSRLLCDLIGIMPHEPLDDTSMLLKEIGTCEWNQELTQNEATSTSKRVAQSAGAVFFVANLALLLSLPPVLRGKGIL